MAAGLHDTLVGQGRPPRDVNYKNWIPYSLNSLNAYDPDNEDDAMAMYTPFQDIIRTVHFGSFVDMGILKPNCLSDTSHSHLTQILSGVEGCWFAPYEPRTKEYHNWYGNVSYIMSLNSFLNSWSNVEAYFMEVTDYRNANASRILLTSQQLSCPTLMKRKYNPRKWGGPWFVDEEGQNFFLHDARRFSSVERQHIPHQVELFLVLTREEENKFQELCRLETANHAQANTNTNRGCKQYRSGLVRENWEPCKTPWSAEETQESVDEYMTGMYEAAYDTDFTEGDVHKGAHGYFVRRK